MPPILNSLIYYKTLNYFTLLLGAKYIGKIITANNAANSNTTNMILIF